MRLSKSSFDYNGEGLINNSVVKVADAWGLGLRVSVKAPSFLKPFGVLPSSCPCCGLSKPKKKAALGPPLSYLLHEQA